MLNTNIFPVFIMMLLGLNSLIAQQNGEIKITNIEHVNTPAREFSPTYYQQGLVYVSSESRRGKMDTKTNESTFDLMYADMGPKGKLSKSGPLSLKVNTPYYEGPVAFSPDMQKMYFTGTNLLNGKVIRDKQGVARLKIYEATRGKDDWEKIKQLPFNDDQFSCIHPTLSKDGQNLYFASDRPGGSGGMDLYVVKWMNGTWSNPMNLGTEVNSPENDVFPYIHPSGKLLFASRRSSSMGGLDIYMADVTSKKPGKVEQLPAPINSTSDDFGILLSNAGSLAFFSSERAGGKGKDDIYRADIPGGLKGLFPPTEFEALVKVLNKETGEALEAAKVTVREIKEGQSVYENNDVFETELIENQDKELLIRYSIRNELFENETKASTDKSGTARVLVTETKKYLVVASKKGFRSNHTTYVAFQTNGTTPVIEIRLWPAVKPVEVPVATLEVGSIIVLDQLYYDFDKSYIRTDASKGLDAILALMKEYPAMKIDLTSFTDSRGTTDYNLDLSARRSGSAKYYLTSRGIEESRIKAYGKGESNPRNRCVDGVKCSEEEYQYNRRTEVKITSLGTDTKRIEYIDNAPEYIDRAKLKKKN